MEERYMYETGTRVGKRFNPKLLSVCSLTTFHTITTMGAATIWQDLVKYRQVYFLTAVAAFGGMLFGWDTGLIGGVLTMKSFQDSFGLDKESPAFSNLSGNIVSVLQAGCFFGAMSS